MNTQERYENKLKLRDIISYHAGVQKALRIEFSAVKAGVPPHARSDRLNPMKKRQVNERAELRYLYLAYALLRDRPYKQVEAKCNDVAQPYLIYVAMKRIGVEDQYPRESIQLWLHGELPAFDVPELPDIHLPVPLNIPEMPDMKAAGGGG